MGEIVQNSAILGKNGQNVYGQIFSQLAKKGSKWAKLVKLWIIGKLIKN